MIIVAGSMLMMLLAVWLLLSQWYKLSLVTEERAEIAERLAPYAGALVAEVDEHVAEARSLGVLVKNSDEVTQAEFFSFMSEVDPAVNSVRLYSLVPGNRFVYVYPDNGGAAALNEDPRNAADAATRAPVEQTIRNGDPALSVTGATGDEQDFDIWLAIYKGNQFWGLVFSSYSLQSIFTKVGLAQGLEGIDVVVSEAGGRVLLDQNGATLDSPVVQTIPLAGGSWELSGVPAGGWGGAVGRELMLFRAGGLAIVILFTSLVYLLASRQGSLARAVRARTEELEESRLRYQQLFEASPDAMFVIGSDGSILDANSLAVQRYGYTNAEFMRMNARELTTPANRGKVPARIARSMAGGGSFEWVHRRRDGTIFPVEINTRPFESGGERFILSSVRDISERVESEAALRDSEEKYRSLFEESRDVVFISTPAGRFLDINAAGVAAFGYASKEELLAVDIGRDLYVDPTVRAAYQNLIASQGFVQDFDVTLRRRDGKKLDMKISAITHRDDDGAVTYRGIIRDVTEQRRLSEQLVQAQKMESVGHLAGGVAHDFNNLLTVVRGYIDLALTDIDEDSVAGNELLQARKAADRAAELTRQMLIFSRREPMDIAVVDLNSALIDLLNMLNRLIGEGYTITTSFGESLGMVEVDVSYIEQVIMNLVVNARDSMPDGGEITITTRNTSVDELYCQENADAHCGDFVRLSIRDDGEGIDAETRLRIFEPFFSTKEVGKGTGLGLSVVYGIVTQLKGWIEVESEPGEGSIFHIYLPVVETRLNAGRRGARGAVTTAGRDERILLVEDEKSVRDIAGRMLGEHGYRVVTAADAREAEEEFQRGEGEFDLIFSDVVLPGEDGFLLSEKLKASHPELKVLLASGYVDDDVLRDIKKSGTPFLQKPYSMERLLRAVREVLED